MQYNDIEIYSTNNEGKSVVAEIIIGNLKNKYQTNVYIVIIEKSDDIVNKYNKIYQSKIKMDSVNVTSNTYIDFNTGKLDKGPKFNVGDHIRTSTYRNFFAERYTPNWSEEVDICNRRPQKRRN